MMQLIFVIWLIIGFLAFIHFRNKFGKEFINDITSLRCMALLIVILFPWILIGIFIAPFV